MTRKTKAPAVPVKAPPTAEAIAEGKAACKRSAERREAVPVTARLDEGGVLSIDATADDKTLHWIRLRDACGTRSDAWVDAMCAHLANAGGAKADDAPAVFEAGVAFLNGVGPRDEVEAALGAQMFAVHRASMKAAQQAGAADTVERFNIHTSAMNKAMRTFTAQVEALAKLRSGGKQQVEVRYVYVDARGGQNIIGSSIGGGGGSSEIRGQPHVADAALAALPPVWGENPPGAAMPPASDERQEAMSEAWGHEPRCPEGAG